MASRLRATATSSYWLNLFCNMIIAILKMIVKENPSMAKKEIKKSEVLLMKKIMLIVLAFLVILVPLSVSADEVVYENVITDSSTIEEDFTVLQSDPLNFSTSTSYYDKWYVVGMSEAYVNDSLIQTYFYFYNPYPYTYNPEFSIKYKMGNGKETECNVDTLEYTKNKGYAKAKGFTYPFTSTTNIYITEVTGGYSVESEITSGFVDERITTSESGFSAKVKHDSKELSIELSYNTTLLINETIAPVIEIVADSNVFSKLNDLVVSPLFTGEKKSMFAVFYNFNFPKGIEVDEILSAKFRYIYNYDRKYWHKNVFTGEEWFEDFSSKEVTLSTYLPGTTKLKANSFSTEFNFQTFYLGDRYKGKEFEDMLFDKEHADMFDYDCSILLDVTYDMIQRGNANPFDGTYHEHHTTIEKIEFLELDYINEGIAYHSQIVTNPIDPEDPYTPEKDKNWWQKLIDWIIAHPGETLAIVVAVVIGIPLIIAFLPKVIELIITLLASILKLILWIIKLPFVIITYPFRKKE